MKVRLPGDFSFSEGTKDYAVLLLHGFTGNTSDVRQLGRFLEKKEIPSYSFNYEGHSEKPEKILQSSPYVWYKQALEKYDELKNKGYEKIYVVGLSIGGVLALKLSIDRDVEAVSTVCSPMFLKTEEELLNNFKTYARNFKKRFEGKEEGEIETEIENYSDLSVFTDIKCIIESTREQLIEVDRPIFIAQGKKDNVINPKSADIIYDEVDSEIKEIKVYENSGHVLPIDNDKEAFFEDYYEFLKDNI